MLYAILCTVIGLLLGLIVYLADKNYDLQVSNTEYEQRNRNLGKIVDKLEQERADLRHSLAKKQQEYDGLRELFHHMRGAGAEIRR